MARRVSLVQASSPNWTCRRPPTPVTSTFMLPLRQVTLSDAVVVLEPMALDHADGLLQAASVRRDTYGLTLVPASAEAMRAYVELGLSDQARGVSIPFVTRDARTQRILGSTP